MVATGWLWNPCSWITGNYLACSLRTSTAKAASQLPRRRHSFRFSLDQLCFLMRCFCSERERASAPVPLPLGAHFGASVKRFSPRSRTFVPRHTHTPARTGDAHKSISCNQGQPKTFWPGRWPAKCCPPYLMVRTSAPPTLHCSLLHSPSSPLPPNPERGRRCNGGK